MNLKIPTIAATLTLAFSSAAVYAGDAKATYDKTCAACHGKEGKGDTAAGKKMGAKDWSDAKVQESLKDEDMSKSIKEGIKEGEKTKMKGYGDKLSDDDIKALVAHIRGFKK